MNHLIVMRQKGMMFQWQRAVQLRLLLSSAVGILGT
jgi:hypothetical protein